MMQDLNYLHLWGVVAGKDEIRELENIPKFILQGMEAQILHNTGIKMDFIGQVYLIKDKEERQQK